MSDSVQKTIYPNYSYSYALATYEKLEKYEVSMQVPSVGIDESVVVRLDGKGLTARFKNHEELFLSDFHLAMKRVMENIKKYCPYVTFAYSFKEKHPHVKLLPLMQGLLFCPLCNYKTIFILVKHLQ